MELLRATYITHTFTRHSHDTFAIGVIDAGVEEFSYQGAVHQAVQDCIVIIHPGEVHTGHAGVPTGWTYRMFYPEMSVLQQAGAEFEGKIQIPYFAQPVLADQCLAAQLRHLHRILEISDSPLERESVLLWTFAQLIQRYAQQCPEIAPLPPEHRIVQSVQDYLITYYANPISLQELADIVNLKPLRLLRLFRQQIGLPPHRYLVQVRVARAKALLSTGVSPAQVAYDTGFTDQSHLNRHFKRLVGVPPGQYALGCKNVQDGTFYAQ